MSIMMDDYHAEVILVLAAAVFLPRVVPALCIDHVRIGPWLSRFLRLTPYAALSALVFPGIFHSVPGHPVAAAVGTAAALAASAAGMRTAGTVVLAVAAVMAAEVLGG